MAKIHCKTFLPLVCLIVVLAGSAAVASAGDRDGVGGYTYKIYGEEGEGSYPVGKNIGMAGADPRAGDALGSRSKPSMNSEWIGASAAIHRSYLWLGIYWLVGLK